MAFDKNNSINEIIILFDKGNGFDGESVLTHTIGKISENIVIPLELESDAKAVRLEFSGMNCCVLKNFYITANNEMIEYKGNFINNASDSDLLFFNCEPFVEFNASPEQNILKISFKYVSVIFGDESDATVKTANSMLYSNNSLEGKSNEELIEIINSQNKTLIQKNTVLKNKDALIADLNKKNINLNKIYAEVIHSFYWRLTYLPRKTTSFIKRVMKKIPFLMTTLVFTKGFLRGGFYEGKKRVLNYKIATGKIKINPLKIPKEQRKTEERHSFRKSPKFSILVPLYNTADIFLKEMIESVQGQTYKNWELCLADGSDDAHSEVGKYCVSLAEKDERIKYVKLDENKGISENTNECLKMATGDYIALFDHDDILHPSALFEYVKVINDKKADFIYCDEATFVREEKDPYKIVFKHHKPEFSPDTLRSYNYICHFTCFARNLYEMVGGFNKDCDGSQDYDLILRLTEKAKSIVRIPKLLYFWRSHALSVASDVSAKPYVVDAAKKALSAHLDRVGLKGEVKDAYAPTTYRIKYEINNNPKVSIIIPNKDHIDDLENCINSILALSTYKNYEIIVVENNSTEDQTFSYYERIQKESSNVKVVTWDQKGFNYSAINNFGAKFATGEYVLLLNNDIEIITPEWIEEMLMFAQRNDVGAVGSKLYFPDDTIQHAGVILGIGGVAGHAHKNYDRNDYGYVSRAVISQNLTACTAACLLIRKDVFDKVNGLDEGFAVAFNDVDLCMKIRKAGYLIVFTPFAEFYHYESKSRGIEDSPEKVARFNGEINRFLKKWGNELEAGDPYYNPNLTLDREDFSFK